MKGDFSRDTFDPGKHFSRVLMQQGRVQLDADWNEQNAILLHYLRTLAKDILGPHAGPSDSRERGFEIFIEDTETTISAWKKAIEGNKDVIIGRGRYYVQGLLVENEREIPYSKQLGIGSENQPPLCDMDWNKDMLFYLDVWERHITHVEDNSIREVALGGPDTCSRTQVVWQVKVLCDNEKPDSLTCKSLSSDSNSKYKLPMLGAGKLRARAGHVKRQTDELCVISPESRYRGAENQLYRVEVHRGGSATDNCNSATFKWSRENGSVTFPIREISGTKVTLEHLGREIFGTKVTLEHLGRDQHLGLKPGDWVEFMDECIAMGKQAGPLARVEIVIHAELTIVVSFPDEVEPACNSEAEVETMHPFLRRWDHAGDVTVFGGALQIVEKASIAEDWIDLEDGVQVQFVKGSLGSSYRAGDYWLIPARVAIGDVEWPDELDAEGNPNRDDNQHLIPAAIEPHGPRHYYAPLFLKGTGSKKQDCRCPIKQQPCTP